MGLAERAHVQHSVTAFQAITSKALEAYSRFQENRMRIKEINGIMRAGK